METLASHLAELLPDHGRVLDVGSGDGRVGAAVAARRPGVEIEGVDVLLRQDPAIPTSLFDGEWLPFGDAAVDTVLLVDVVHHASTPLTLLAEARRVARDAVIVKDHTADGVLAGPTLRLMDHLGNARHGVAIPGNYWSRARWLETIDALGLRVVEWRDRLGLYPWPASALFERSLHFVARLEPVR